MARGRVRELKLSVFCLHEAQTALTQLSNSRTFSSAGPAVERVGRVGHVTCVFEWRLSLSGRLGCLEI